LGGKEGRGGPTGAGLNGNLGIDVRGKQLVGRGLSSPSGSWGPCKEKTTRDAVMGEEGKSSVGIKQRETP